MKNVKLKFKILNFEFSCELLYIQPVRSLPVYSAADAAFHKYVLCLVHIRRHFIFKFALRGLNKRLIANNADGKEFALLGLYAEVCDDLSYLVLYKIAFYVKRPCAAICGHLRISRQDDPVFAQALYY